MLTGIVAAGPKNRTGELPARIDVLGQHTENPATWRFTCVQPPVRGQETAHPHPTWTLRPAFGVTEAGLILMGITLGLATVPGVGETGHNLVHRARLNPGKEVLVSSRLLDACKTMRSVPLVVSFSALTAERRASFDEIAAPITALTGWRVVSEA